MHGAANRAASVEVQREIRTRKTTRVPAIDPILIATQRSGNRFFGSGAIRPSGSGGNVALAVEAFAKFFVGTADVFVERVSAALLVAAEIIAIARAGLPCCIAFVSATVRGSRLRVSRRRCRCCFAAGRAIFRWRRLASDGSENKQ